MKNKRTNLETKQGKKAEFKQVDEVEIYADIKEGLKLLGIIELFRHSKHYEVNTEILLNNLNWGFYINTIYDRREEEFFVVEIALPQEYFE
jgi:hypothetical protein